MKHARRFFVILLLLMIFCRGFEAMAADTGFTVDALPQERIDTILENINITRIDEEPRKQGIFCFDVNERGEIAIGYKDFFAGKTVCVYSSDGAFQYGYRFQDLGSYGIELEEDILKIYFVRGEIAVTVNSLGEIVSVTEIQDTRENNSYWRQILYKNKWKIGETEYVLRNEMGILNIFCASYSRLVVIDGNGTEQIFHDVHSTMYVFAIIKCILISGFVITVLIGVAREMIKRR